MNYYTLFFIAVALAMDSFAISVSSGMVLGKIKTKYLCKFSAFLAITQGLMPVVGWFAGYGLEKVIKMYDHWIAFILLGFLGGKMIYEGFSYKETKGFNPLNNITLIGLALATSIDALVIGISFGLLGHKIFFPAIAIACVTFLFSFVGYHLGTSIVKRIKIRPEIIGGIVLIGIGTKILIEHLSSH